MYHAIAVGKGVLKISKILNLGAGSTWPGHISLKADSKLVRKVLKKNPDIKIVLVAGTNGKTTTTRAMSHILETNGFSTLTNKAGANLLNGLASLLVENVSLTGTLRHKALIFEVDENSLPLVLSEIPNPDAIVLLDLFRDQLDRYGEVNTTAEKWKNSLEKLTQQTLVIANADDPLISYVTGFSSNKLFFTIDNGFKNNSTFAHAVDSTICPQCRNPLNYSGISYSHLGNYKCQSCGFQNPKAKQFTFKNPLIGTYNVYNLTAAILVADKIFKVLPYTSTQDLASLKPAFGRQEVLDIDNKKVMLLLSKNPTGFNESLKVATQNKSVSLLLLLNDRVPDGRDISWIWDVDFEELSGKNLCIAVAGDRALDMANRLLFANVTHEVFEDFGVAYKELLKKTPDGKTLTTLPTYSAMLEIRKLIGGKSIL